MHELKGARADKGGGCRNARAAKHKVEFSAAPVLRLVHCGDATFKFVAAAMHDVWLPQLAGVGRI